MNALILGIALSLHGPIVNPTIHVVQVVHDKGGVLGRINKSEDLVFIEMAGIGNADDRFNIPIVDDKTYAFDGVVEYKGTFRYTAVTGAEKTIQRYRFTHSTEIKARSNPYNSLPGPERFWSALKIRGKVQFADSTQRIAVIMDKDGKTYSIEYSKLTENELVIVGKVVRSGRGVK